MPGLPRACLPWLAALAAGVLWGSSLGGPLSAIAVLSGAALLPWTITGSFRADLGRALLFGILWYGLSLTWFPGTWNTYWGRFGHGIWLGFIGLQVPVVLLVHGLSSALSRWALPLAWAAVVPWMYWIQPLPADPALLLGDTPLLLWPGALGGRPLLNLVLLGLAVASTRSLLVGTGGVVLWVLVGAVWLALPEGGPTQNVALVQPNTGAFDGRRSSTAGTRAKHLLDLLAEVEAADPDWIATPEGAWPLWVGDAPDSGMRRRFLQDWPLSTPVVLGASPRAGDLPHNSLLVVESGEVPDRYDKRFLVPLAEEVRFGLGHTRYHSGERSRLLEIAGARVAPLICYEDLLSPALLEAVNTHPDVLLSATNDVWSGPGRAARQHRMGARLAAVTTGRWVVRATTSGLSAFIDPRGRLHRPIAFGDGDETPLSGEVRVQQIRLHRPRIPGQTVGWLLAVLSALFLLGWARYRARFGPPEQEERRSPGG